MGADVMAALSMARFGKAGSRVAERRSQRSFVKAGAAAC